MRLLDRAATERNQEVSRAEPGGRRSTYRATKLRETGTTEHAQERLNKPNSHERLTPQRYRTQEVAGSSPASSTKKRLLTPGASAASAGNGTPVLPRFYRSDLVARVPAPHSPAQQLPRGTPAIGERGFLIFVSQ
jgi:hypothetical protein